MYCTMAGQEALIMPKTVYFCCSFQGVWLLGLFHAAKEPIVNINISYTGTLKGCRAFGLHGTSRLAEVMFERHAVIGNIVDEVELNWNNELFEQRMKEKSTLLKRRALMSCCSH